MAFSNASPVCFRPFVRHQAATAMCSPSKLRIQHAVYTGISINRPQPRLARMAVRMQAFRKRSKNAAKDSSRMPVNEEPSDELQLKNKTIPFQSIKQALALEEGIIAVLGRGFEVTAVLVMTLYGLKALEIGLHDSSLFVQFFFEGGAPDDAISEQFDLAFMRIRESLGQGIIMGLEFLIISDIFESVSKPLEERTLYDLGKLGLVVVIRTIIDLSLRGE